MPRTCIDTADAIELTETLQLIAGWLAADPATLTPSLLAYIGHPAYGPGGLRADLERFTFLLGGSDGEHLFGPRRDDGAMSPAAPPTGQVIFLNGTSSSGKSSIAEQLLLILDRPFFHLSVDAISGMRARERTLELGPDELAAVLARTRAGFHRAAAGMAQAGNDLVVDYVLSEPWRLLDCLTVLRGLDVVLVGVRCSGQELARREKARGDRPPGQAAAQLRQVHSYGSYDIECDTTTASPRDCAHLIRQSLDRLPAPRAFDRLRSGLLD
jgi:chloramphenicol 3-O phosphotransferase